MVFESGTITELITPFKDNGNIDYDILLELFEMQLKQLMIIVKKE